MSKISWKPGTMLAPVPPVMVTCGTMEKPNVLTVAWTGIINSEPPLTYISIRPSRYSHDIIKESGEFVINLSTLELAKACDYCGVKSGKNTDKFKDMNLEIEPCSQVKAPMLVKAPISLECKVKSITPYPTHDMFLAEIVNVNIDDKYLEEDGRLALEKAGLLAFVHGRYYTLGRDLGAFGFSVDKTKENKTKPRKSKFAELIEQEKAADAKPVKLERPPFKKSRSYHSEGPNRDRHGKDEAPRRENRYSRDDDNRRGSRFGSEDGPRRDNRYSRDDDTRRGNRYGNEEGPRRESRYNKDERTESRKRPENKFDGKSKFAKARRDNDKPGSGSGNKNYGNKPFRKTVSKPRS